MPPAPVRTPSKRSIAALPESSRLTFLLAASQLLASSVPQASSHLGCQALKWADTKQLPLPRGPIAQLCRHCGAPCNSKDAMLVKNSRAQRHRQLQADTHTQNRHSEWRVAAVIPCQVCGSTYVRSFVNKDAAHKAFPLAAMMPAVKAAAQHPANDSKHKAATGLKALSQPHQTLTTLHSREELPYSHQQAAERAVASIPEPEVAQPASTPISPQPRWEENGSSPLDSCSQPASPDPSADNVLKPASFRSVTPGSSIAHTQDADLSMQQDLTVNKPESPQGALLELNHQPADVVGSLSHATQQEIHQVSGHQTAQPSCNVGDMTVPLSDPFSIKQTVQGADGMEIHNALIHNETEVSASGALQTMTNTAFPAGEAQAGLELASATLSTAPEVADFRRQHKHFSWRKHGRSWRRMALKKSQNVSGSS